jgi:hypothetical protein
MINWTRLLLATHLTQDPLIHYQLWCKIHYCYCYYIHKQNMHNISKFEDKEHQSISEICKQNKKLDFLHPHLLKEYLWFDCLCIIA